MSERLCPHCVEYFKLHGWVFAAGTSCSHSRQPERHKKPRRAVKKRTSGERRVRN